MKHYRLSVLALRYSTKDGAALHRLHDEEWLVWEPGIWHAPTRSGETLLESSQAPLQLSQREPLAFPIARGASRFATGKSPSSAIAVNDGTLSSVHLALSSEGPRWTLRDLGSSNGTKLDGQLASPQVDYPLRSGMEIRAGAVVLTFYSSRGDARAPGVEPRHRFGRGRREKVLRR